MKGYDYDCKLVCSLDGEEFNGEIYNTREDAVMAGTIMILLLELIKEAKSTT